MIKNLILVGIILVSIVASFVMGYFWGSASNYVVIQAYAVLENSICNYANQLTKLVNTQSSLLTVYNGENYTVITSLDCSFIP